MKYDLKKIISVNMPHSQYFKKFQNNFETKVLHAYLSINNISNTLPFLMFFFKS